jgi:TRAP-type mannitol/chloroaromatic compound transport system substrate-binding protein
VERRNFIKKAGFGTTAVAATALATPALAQAMPEIRWRHTSAFPKSLDTLFGVCDVFAKKVGELSGGKFTISTHGGNGSFTFFKKFTEGVAGIAHGGGLWWVLLSRQ